MVGGSGPGSVFSATTRAAVDKYALCVVVLAIAFLSPFSLLLISSLCLLFVNNRTYRWIFLISIFLFFTLLNIGKEVDGDLVNYLDLQEYLKVAPFTSLFNDPLLVILTGSYRPSEIGFYGPIWVIAHFTSDYRTVTSIISTVGIYFPLIMGLFLIGRTARWNPGFTAAIIFFAVFASINVSQTTHLIRQYISTSILFYGFALLMAKRRLSGLLVLLFSCSIHNAAALVVLDTISLAMLFPFGAVWRGRFISLSFRLCIAVGLFGVSMLLAGVQDMQHTESDEITISVWHYAALGAVLMAFILVPIANRNSARLFFYARIAFMVVYLLSIGFFVFGIKIYALRYFVYLEWLVPLVVAHVLLALPVNRDHVHVALRLAVCVAAICVIAVRIALSPWNYGPNQNNLFTWDFFEVARLVTH